MEDAKQAGMDRAGELPLERRVAERRKEPPALVTTMASTIVALKAEELLLHSQLAHEKLRADQGWLRYEAANASHQSGLGEIAALKEQLAAARRANFTEAAEICASAPHGDMFGYHIAERFRALASQPAAPVQPADDMNSFGAIRKSFAEHEDFTEFPSDAERDGALNYYGWGWQAALKLAQAAPPVQQPGDARGNLDSLDISGASVSQVSSQALATTRPSAALTDEQINEGLRKHRLKVDEPSQLADAFRHGMKYANTILAASSGALAVPEGWQPIESAPKDGCWVLATNAKTNATRQHVVSFVATAETKFKWRTGSGHMEWVDGLTHWMPLPAAPAIPAQGQTK